MSHRLSRTGGFGWNYPLLAAIFTTVLMGQQQSSANRPKFEVASVKPCKGNTWDTNGGETDPGRLTVHCEAVVNLVRQAFGLFRDGKMNERGRLTKVEGGPAWAYSDLYEIEAKADGRQVASVMQGPMMQSLLEDRFKLKVHLETREVQVYVITAVKGGIRLPVAKQGCYTIGPGYQLPSLPPADLRLLRCGHADTRNHEFHLHGATVADLCNALSRMPFDRPFIDKTGDKGPFDFDFKWTLVDRGEPDAAGAPMPATGPENLFMAYQTALGKLGLKIDSGKGPGEFLIIDHMERPSAN